MAAVRHRQAESWHEYLAAARLLETVSSDDAPGDDAQGDDADRVHAAAATLRSALARQRARLAGRARSGVSPAALARARAAVTDDPATVWRALRRCDHLIRLADRQLAAAPRHAGRWLPTWSPGRARVLRAALSLVLLLAVA